MNGTIGGYYGSRPAYNRWIGQMIQEIPSRQILAKWVRIIRKESTGFEARHFLAHADWIGSYPVKAKQLAD